MGLVKTGTRSGVPGAVMRKALSVVLLLALMCLGTYLVGRWYGQPKKKVASADRRVLFYVDPMHTAYKSAHPGIAPDCGMELEPVYADGLPARPEHNSASPSGARGTVQLSSEQQQLIGVRIAQVAEDVSAMRTLRTVGRIAPDETRVLRVVAAIDGWIRSVPPIVTGSVVRKDEVLATYYNRDFLTAQQTYLYALGLMDRLKNNENADQLKLVEAQIRSAEDNLEFLGMSETQLKEIARTRQVTRNIELRSPLAGVVLARNAFTGLRFDRGAELFQIADLSHVWVLTDAFDGDAQYFKPGMVAHLMVPRSQTILQAKVSNSVPQFDSPSRTLKVRLETANPGLVLRPGMLVDVELPIKLPSGLSIPADAVVDSGLRKRVYVDRGGGSFEPREIEVGWREGDRVQILKGLAPGERIAASGTFLLDSESRLRADSGGAYGASVKDPVCGMDIDQDKANAAGRKSENAGVTYYFCSETCNRKFVQTSSQLVPPQQLRKPANDDHLKTGLREPNPGH